MTKLEFKPLRDFERGIIYKMLKEAYSFDERYFQLEQEKWKAEADDFFFDHLHIADMCVFISTIDDEPIGVVMWDPRKLPNEVEIGHNCIIPKYKGHGYGKIQMTEAIRRILQQGAKKIIVSTNADLIPAQRMYESVGFEFDRKEPVDAFFGAWIFYKYPVVEKRKKLKVTPNFHFRGDGKQAIELYKRAFGAEVKVLLCNSDANLEDCVAVDEKQKDLVYHADIYIGEQRIILTDDPEAPLPNTNPLSLLVTFESAEEMKIAYEMMADDATIVYPLQSTTFSSCFVSLVDKFGMRWELMIEEG